MSTISAAMQTALGVLGTAAGQTLYYRTGPTGAWVALAPSGATYTAFLEQGDPQVLMYDDKNNAVVAPARATLRIAVGGPRLKPGTGGTAYQVKHVVGTSVTQWGVAAATHNDGLSVYELAREVAQAQGNPRDAVPR